jgi:protein SCO1/2
MRKGMSLRRAAMAAMLAGGVALGVAHSGIAHDAHQHAAGETTAPMAAHVTLQDIGLVDRDGRAVRFKSEAVGDRIVVVDFIYTSCTTICPVTSAAFAEVQQRLIGKLGEQFGRDVQLISLTIDPATDTPQRLNDYAGHFGVRAGWLWLTGDKPRVDKVLRGLGGYAVDIERHSGAVLVGDGRGGNWMRFYGIPKPADIVNRVEQLLTARAQATFSGGR